MNKDFLIISNNCISKNNNNGKTLYNIFEDEIKKKNVANLYLSTEKQELDLETFNINECDLIRNVFKTESKKNKSIYSVKPNELIRLVRELIWLFPFWRSHLFKQWVSQINPKIIFFLAGDSIFSYRIVNYISTITRCKLYVYYTDDYYFKKSSNPFFKIRSFFVKKRIKTTITKADKLFFISPLMQSQYNLKFNCDGNLLGIVPKLDAKIKDSLKMGKRSILYTGNLTLGRLEVIKEFSKTIECLDDKIDICLDIFSATKLKYEDLHFFENLKKTNFNGFITSDEIYKIKDKYEFCLLVESFRKENKEITRYSFSTKIMDYLSMGKCIIAIGPSDVSSIDLMRDCSIYLDTIPINRLSLELALNDSELIQDNINKSVEKYYEIEQKFIESKKNIFEGGM